MVHSYAMSNYLLSLFPCKIQFSCHHTPDYTTRKDMQLLNSELIKNVVDISNKLQDTAYWPDDNDVDIIRQLFETKAPMMDVIANIVFSKYLESDDRWRAADFYEAIWRGDRALFDERRPEDMRREAIVAFFNLLSLDKIPKKPLDNLALQMPETVLLKMRVHKLRLQ